MRLFVVLNGLVFVLACSDGEPSAAVDAGAADAGACADWDEEMPAVAEMMGVFDAQRRKMVFFGGDDVLPVNCRPTAHKVGRGEIYSFDAVCARFREELLDEGPRGRARGMAAYDPEGDRMFMFGGRSRGRETGPYHNYNEVWSLNLDTLAWTEHESTTPAPSPRSNPAGGFNRQTGELIIFGGNTSTDGLAFTVHNDVWAFNPNTNAWRRVASTGPEPSERLFHAAAVDDINNRLFIYGGGGAMSWQGGFMTDLWVMDLNTGTWTELAGANAGGPAARIWSTITYDATADRVLLFGGHDEGDVGNNNDTWSFDLDTERWEQITAPEVVNRPGNGQCDFPADFTVPNLQAPERRSAHLAAQDTARGEWVIFGGKTDCGIINDVWSFDMARDAWINVLPATVGKTCQRGDNPEACVALCN